MICKCILVNLAAVSYPLYMAYFKPMDAIAASLNNKMAVVRLGGGCPDYFNLITGLQ